MKKPCLECMRLTRENERLSITPVQAEQDKRKLMAVLKRVLDAGNRLAERADQGSFEKDRWIEVRDDVEIVLSRGVGGLPPSGIGPQSGGK